MLKVAWLSLVLVGVAVGQGPAANDGWQRWWELNKAPFVGLKAAIHHVEEVNFYGGGSYHGGMDRDASMKPTERTIVQQILPTLKKALDANPDPDIKTSCILAFAKIGKDHPDFKILDVFRKHLSSKDLEIRESAVLAMGISQIPSAIPDLIELATDSRKGRTLLGRSEVDGRSRCFAAYGLGLIAYATSAIESKRFAFEALKELAEAGNLTNKSLKVAAIHGMSLLNPNPKDAPSRELLTDCLDTLERLFAKGTDRHIKAQVPTAIAKLLHKVEVGELAKRKTHFKRMLLFELTDKSKPQQTENLIAQSCVMALGQMAKPYIERNGDSLDHVISRYLANYSKKGWDQQARQFSLLALGLIGGSVNRSALFKALDDGDEATMKPWAALALGIYAFKAFQDDPDAALEQATVRALVHWFHKVRNQDTRAAIALALGLSRYCGDEVDMLDMLSKEKNSDQFKGYLCISLGLGNHQRAINDLTHIVKTSTRHPERLNQATVALAKLGDKGVTDLLQNLMVWLPKENSEGMAVMASLLGRVGDRRSVNPLTKMLLDKSLSAESRAAAATALGNIADKELLPWNSKIAVGINYRAAVGALTNGSNGILDIL